MCMRDRFHNQSVASSFTDYFSSDATETFPIHFDYTAYVCGIFHDLFSAKLMKKCILIIDMNHEQFIVNEQNIYNG